MAGSDSLFVIDPSHLVRFVDMDAHHRRMVRMLADMAAGLERGEAPGQLDEQFDDYMAFTRVHFRHEERLMETSLYANREGHEEAHARLLQQNERLREQFREGEREEVLAVSYEWLIAHIERHDMPLGNFLGRAA